MSCPADTTITLYVDGDLDGAAFEALRKHVEGCAECRARVAIVMADAAPPTRKADPLTVGSILVGKYRVLAVLGAGGMGVVVSAMHEELAQRVAIKVLHADSLNDGDSVKRFLREGRAAAKLRSDHAVRIYDVGRLPDGAPFLVMEHLEGEDLASLLRKGPLDVEASVGYVLQAIEAIGEAHAEGLVHRDIKPANLFLATMPNGETRVKVLDFGLAKELRGLASSTDSDLTTEHALLGSPMFMSPEQIRDPRGVDKRTDIWSLGTTLWQLVTGESPFSRSSVQTTLAEVCTKKLPPASSVRPGVPRHVDEAIARCMHKDPEGRFPNVEELAAALRQRQPANRRQLSVSVTDTSGTPGTSRMGELPQTVFKQTLPMAAAPMPAGLAHSASASASATPRSAPTFVRPHQPPPVPSRSGPPLGLAIVAALALAAIGVFAATQLIPRTERDATPSSPSGTPSSMPSAMVTVASSPPMQAITTGAGVDAPPSAAPSATTTAPKVAPTAQVRRPPSPASASAHPPSKDPYDR